VKRAIAAREAQQDRTPAKPGSKDRGKKEDWRAVTGDAMVARIWEYLTTTRPNARGEQGGEGNAWFEGDRIQPLPSAISPASRRIAAYNRAQNGFLITNFVNSNSKYFELEN
jgi:hypothetical protein